MKFKKYNSKEKKKKKKSQKLLKNIYTKFALKNSLFLKVIVGYKNEN